MYLQRNTFPPKQTGLSTEESVKIYVNPFVEVENVTLSYSEEIRDPAVQELSMSISEGEFWSQVCSFHRPVKSGSTVGKSIQRSKLPEWPSRTQ